jgi:periplasmic divalent cation tolerance protein
MDGYLVALTTCPQDKSEELAHLLVKSKYCACVNIISSVKSIYHWKGEIVTDDETLLAMKTTDEHKENLWKTIRENHPYETPEYIVLPIMWGSSEYLKWIEESTSFSD